MLANVKVVIINQPLIQYEGMLWVFQTNVEVFIDNNLALYQTDQIYI